MKKVVLLCVAALCVAACHCERKTTGTPCRKAACQCKTGKAQKQCKCHDVWMGVYQKACSCTTSCKEVKKAHKPAPAVKRPLPPPPAPVKTVEAKAAEQSAALSAVGKVKQEGNKIALAYKEPIRFGHNSAKVDPASYKELDATANILKKYPDNTITVKGYTDSLGNPAYNVDLSQRRAQAVADELVSRGVNPANVKAEGLGAANPIASNSTAEGRRLNRRVELEVNVK